jgi:uncharacterized membrane protein YfhO
VADAYDEGWRARVDGVPATVLRADMAFRAVALRAGRHTVEMAYRPPDVLASVVVTLVSLAALLGLLRATRGFPDATPAAAGRSNAAGGTGDEP